MKKSRLLTLVTGLLCGVAYAFITMMIVNATHRNVSIAYIFVFPLVLGAIPVLFSTKEQLKSYYFTLLLPVLSVLTFFYLSLISGFEGLICLVVIVGPFLVLGAIGGFVLRLIKLKKRNGNTPLYCSLLLPFLALIIESGTETTDCYYVVRTSININANKSVVWEHVKNVKNIKPDEVRPHFIHAIGVPKPISGELDSMGIGGVRNITWEKGIRFREVITEWNEGQGFSYDIHVDPKSIPPTTLDEHVMVGGRYFDVVAGSYQIDSLGPAICKATLCCRYRITTSLNTYSKWWADYILNDFHEMILEVIKHRCEQQVNS